MKKFKVTIAGGGFGGIKAALELAEDRLFDITIISELDSFRYYPTLYVTATGGKKNISTIPLTKIFANKKINIIQDTVTKIDKENNTVFTKSGNKIKHDAVIFALGVTTNYFGIKGLKEFSYGIKSTDDAERLKNHLHKQIIEERRIDTNYVVVGGGPTGVELAGSLPYYINKIASRHGLPERKVHVDLVEASPRILPKMSKDVSIMTARHLRKIGIKLYLNSRVEAQTADALMVHNKPIRSHTVIWTAGVSNNSFFMENDFQLTKNGKVRVDQFLQAEPGIYVIGDNADTPFSGMAQTALHDGHYVAKNLKLVANKQEPEAYVAKKPVYVVPAGPKYAAVVWGKFRIYGIFGWLLRRAADFIAYNDYLPWTVAAELWMAEDDEETSCIRCAAHF